MGFWELFEPKPPSPLWRGKLCTALAPGEVVTVTVPRYPDPHDAQAAAPSPQPNLCTGANGRLCHTDGRQISFVLSPPCSRGSPGQASSLPELLAVPCVGCSPSSSGCPCS